MKIGYTLPSSSSLREVSPFYQLCIAGESNGWLGFTHDGRVGSLNTGWMSWLYSVATAMIGIVFAVLILSTLLSTRNGSWRAALLLGMLHFPGMPARHSMSFHRIQVSGDSASGPFATDVRRVSESMRICISSYVQARQASWRPRWAGLSTWEQFNSRL